MSTEQTAYPLSWPARWPRTKFPGRSRFGSYYKKPSVAAARDEMLAELRKLGAGKVIISTNIQLQRDGLPYSNQKEPADAGAAVYFTLNGKPRVLACDRWNTEGDNLWAIAKHRWRPSVDYMCILHRMFFHEVHPWAGEIRQPGRLPPRVGGFITCEPERLQTELRMLEGQTAELLTKADRQSTLRGIAFHHARFEMLHPFLDGNGRVGRPLVESQLDTSAFGVRERPEVPRQEYGDALQTSSRISNLLPVLKVNILVDYLFRSSVLRLSTCLCSALDPIFSAARKTLSETNHGLSVSDNVFCP